MSEFAKTNTALEVKGGVLDGKVIDADGVKALADLPSREQLVAQVLRGMQSPISGLAGVLQGTFAICLRGRSGTEAKGEMRLNQAA